MVRGKAVRPAGNLGIIRVGVKGRLKDKSFKGVGKGMVMVVTAMVGLIIRENEGRLDEFEARSVADIETV